MCDPLPTPIRAQSYERCEALIRNLDRPDQMLANIALPLGSARNAPVHRVSGWPSRVAAPALGSRSGPARPNYRDLPAFRGAQTEHPRLNPGANPALPC